MSEVREFEPPARVRYHRSRGEAKVGRRVLYVISAADILAAYVAPLHRLGFWPVVPLSILILVVLFSTNIAGYTFTSLQHGNFAIRVMVMWAIMAALTGTLGHGAGWLLVTGAGVLAAALVYTYTRTSLITLAQIDRKDRLRLEGNSEGRERNEGLPRRHSHTSAIRAIGDDNIDVQGVAQKTEAETFPFVAAFLISADERLALTQEGAGAAAGTPELTVSAMAGLAVESATARIATIPTENLRAETILNYP